METHHSSAALRAHLSQIVQAQAAALRAGDYSGARRHAAHALRSKFSDETFGIMVFRGYPLIAESAEVQVFGARDNGTQAWLTVRFTGQGGEQGWYRYQLVREPGGWKISAVVPIDPPIVTV